MKYSIRSLAAYAMICLLTLFMGCSGGGGGSGGSGGSTGTLALSLTDAPSAEYEAVYVTIDRVDVHLGGNEANPKNWKTITESGDTEHVKRTYNLLELQNGVLEFLGETDLEAGVYTQMRLIIGDNPDGRRNIFGDAHAYANYIIDKSGTTVQQPLKVPSGTQTGIKLVKSFTVGKNQLTELILDFDADKSVHRAGSSGKYILKPTIKVLDAIALHNYIEGTVFDEDGMGLGGVSVSAQVSDASEEIKDQVVVAGTSTTEEDGWFRILVPPGTGPYNIVAYKDTYGLDFECGVDVASGVTTQLILLDLESGVTPGYGYVSGNVSVPGGGDLTISFRTPGCEGNIEVKSKTISLESVNPEVLYKEILPVLSEVFPQVPPNELYYEVVASSVDKSTDFVSGVTVEGGVTRFLLPLVVE